MAEDRLDFIITILRDHARKSYLREYQQWRKSQGLESHDSRAIADSLQEIEAHWAAREISQAERRAYRRVLRQLTREIRQLMKDEEIASIRGYDWVARLYRARYDRLGALLYRLIDLDPDR